jgi:hypothetical protein
MAPEISILDMLEQLRAALNRWADYLQIILASKLGESPPFSSRPQSPTSQEPRALRRVGSDG